jgi:hypothetical protein
MPGQVELALAQIRDRRRRSAWAAASSLTVLVLLACVATTWRPGLDAGLDPANPGVAQTATAVPSSRGSVGETHRPTGPRLAPPRVALQAGALSYSAVVSRSLAAATPEPTPTPVAASPRYRPRRPSGYDSANSATDPMSAGWPGDACVSPTWCSSGKYRRVADGLEFGNQACPPSRAGATLWFRNDLEMDLTLTRAGGGAVLWRWSDGQRFPAHQHMIYIGQGACLLWRIGWDGILDDGTPLPPGRYTMAMRMYADVDVPASAWTFQVG